MKKTVTKKAASKVAAKKPAVKESPILKDVKQLYGFMKDNNLDTIEYDQKGLYLRLVKAKPAVVPVPVSVGGAAAAAGAGLQAGRLLSCQSGLSGGQNQCEMPVSRKVRRDTKKL